MLPCVPCMCSSNPYVYLAAAADAVCVLSGTVLEGLDTPGKQAGSCQTHNKKNSGSLAFSDSCREVQASSAAPWAADGRYTMRPR